MMTEGREAPVAQLVRWSWFAASVLGAVTLTVLLYQALVIAAYIWQPLLVAVSYLTVMLPMFLLESVVAGRPWRVLVSAALSAFALLFCRELFDLYDTASVYSVEYAIAYPLTLAWTVALAAALAAMGANVVHRRCAST